MTDLRGIAARQALNDAKRLSAARQPDYRDRLLAASRAASALDHALRPLSDIGLTELVDALQWRISKRLAGLADKPEGDAG